MKQLVILSGKGGSGKTSVAAAFSHLASERNSNHSVVLADADVDAANLELVLAPQELGREDFWVGQVAEIDQSICIGCGICMTVCRFDAIQEREGIYKVDPISCEGCATCFYACPMDSILMTDQIAGEWFRSESRYGPLFHAALHPARENSGKLVTLIKQHAKLLTLDEGYELVMVDGPPGIGCPVISATSGADLALIVAEPSMAGVHDMWRIVETTQHFGVPTVICVNKYDLYEEGTLEITTYCQKQGIEVLGLIPFDEDVTLAMANGEPVTAYKPEGAASRAIRELWKQVESELADEGNER
jgi:MinD superfamily P-loop ATPase